MPDKTIAVVQSSYIPWKGYFDLVNSVDEFVLYDDVQFRRADWRNRNKIKTAHGLLWLTIPVQNKGRYRQRICDTQVNGSDWQKRHWQSIAHAYSRSEYFSEHRELLEELFLGCCDTQLSKINYRFLSAICELLGISTPLTWSSQFELPGAKSERLVAVCQQAGATRYLSGPRAKDYLDEKMFARAGIDVLWMDYQNYPEYRQLFPPFEHAVSVVDLLLNEGPNARSYMKSFGATTAPETQGS